jgi:hypothetical protein
MIAALHSDMSAYVLMPLSGGTTMMFGASDGRRFCSSVRIGWRDRGKPLISAGCTRISS